MTGTNARWIRWASYLQEFNFKIIYKAGKKNANADTLSKFFEEEE